MFRTFKSLAIISFLLLMHRGEAKYSKPANCPNSVVNNMPPTNLVDVDIDQSASCNNYETAATISMVWNDIDQIRDGINNPSTPSQLRWKKVSCTKKGKYQYPRFSCDVNGQMIVMGKKQFKDCRAKMIASCQQMEPNMCPCYDTKTLFSNFEALNQFKIDPGESCKVGGPMAIATSPNFGGTKAMCSFNSSNKWCMNTSGRVMSITSTQLDKCESVMEESCEALDVPTCYDEREYEFEGKTRKNCQWAALEIEGKKRRCWKMDRFDKTYVYEHCRWTCNACECKDMPQFYLGNDRTKDCGYFNSLKNSVRPQDRQQFETYRKIPAVSRSCMMTCGSGCCMDNPNFKFTDSMGTVLKCTDIPSRQGLCMQRNIARHCKAACNNCQ